MTRRALPVLLLAVVLAPAAPAQLRVVTWNVSDGAAADFATGQTPDRRSAVTTVLSAIGTESVNGFARPIDVFLIQEARLGGGTGTTFVNILNGLYGAGSYARGTAEGASSGAGTQTIVYRTATVNLVAEKVLALYDGTTNGAARDPLRHRIQPAGYSAGDVYFYNSHYKSDTSSQSRRLAEATAIRADADALGAGVRAVYTGDFNVYTSAESAYQKLRSAGAAQAIDPVLPSGDWTADTLANRKLHSQSPVTTPLYPSEATGGMNDRFDLLLPTANMDPAAGRGVHQIGGSYHVFGNNGTHAKNGELTSGSQPANVLTALRQTSEHLPVVVDYYLPARLTATVAVANPRVIRGQSAGVTLSVSNTPPVVAGPSAFVAAGVDPLDYTFAGGGGVTGSGGANGLAASAGPTPHALSVPTVAAGLYTGVVSATATSAQAANPFGSANVSVTALDPSRGSFDNVAPVTTQTVHFGNVTAGQASTRQLAVYNLVTTAGFTADLRYISLTEATAGGPLTATLAPTSPDLPAGGGNWTLTLTANSATTGPASDTFTLNLSDENILGATPQVLTVLVDVTFVPVPEPGAVAFLLAAAGAVGYARRWRR